jgi:hypothetical protein
MITSSGVSPPETANEVETGIRPALAVPGRLACHPTNSAGSGEIKASDDD